MVNSLHTVVCVDSLCAVVRDDSQCAVVFGGSLCAVVCETAHVLLGMPTASDALCTW